jgi:hypothetical protein
VDWQQNAVQNIIRLCHEKISKWLKASPQVRTIRQLESLVCERIKLVFEEVWNDEDLHRIIQKYRQMGENIFATLKCDLDAKTFAALIERRHIDGTSRDRYVAVIDCRGEKGARRFFTRWHEIAHILTLQGQLQLPLHRSRTDKTPTERLMDAIAAEIGFYDSFFRPILDQELASDGNLSFGIVERIRARFSSEASFQATLNACVSRVGAPALVVEVGLGLKKDEQRQLNSSQSELLPGDAPEPKLRVLTVASNNASRGTNLQIHRNIQVPKTSLLYSVFFNHEEFPANEAEGTENLNTWRHSSGAQSLADVEVTIRARRIQNSIIALISPVAW